MKKKIKNLYIRIRKQICWRKLTTIVLLSISLFLSCGLNDSTSRLENLELGACVFRFSVHREVQPPTTDLLADWIDGWSWQLGGGRRRTGPALAIPAGAALGYVQRILYRVGGFERGIQAHRSRRSRASMGRA